MTQRDQDAFSQIFHDVFDDDSIVIRPDLTADEVDGWDSLTHVRLLLTIERKFGIKFTASEVGQLESLGDLTKLIDGKLAQSGSRPAN